MRLLRLLNLPRLRIAHQLALLLAGAVMLAVLAVGALSAWNLRTGFVDYLRLRDEEQLMRFVQLIERRAATDPTMGWLRNNRESMRELMDELMGRPERGRRPPPPHPPPQFDPDRPPPPERAGRPPPPPRDGGDFGNLAERLVVRDSQGNRLAGRPQPPGIKRTVRAVKVDGVEVAFVELVAGPNPVGVDARFLQHQYNGLVFAALGTVVITVLMGVWVARRWSRPLRELQLATRRIAKGEKAVLIPSGSARGGTASLVQSGALEIDELISDVNAMSQALGALDDARRTWIAQISHELRTPLAVLRGELESIEDGARQPTREVIASLQEEVAQLNRLVDDLHTLTMADLGQMPCQFVTGDANEALQRTAKKFQVRAKPLGITVQIQPGSDPIAAQWDFGRMDQVLSNLLENSLRYTHAPGQIEISWQTSAGTLQLLVQDSAPGVPAADLARLFDPLFRGDVSRTRTGQHSSGLGLSIVRAIVHAHRGTIDITPSPLGGLAVRVELPLVPQGLERRKREP